MKKHNFKLILSLSWVLATMALVPNKVMAQYYSQSQDNQTLVVDKQLRSVDTNSFSDNILSSQKVFVENDVVEFKIIVSNKGNQDDNNIKIIDKLPRFLSLIFNPGTYDKSTNTVNWTIDKLIPGESKEYLIRAKISNSDKLSTSASKQTNVAIACTDTSICDNDQASYFVSGRQMPTTGSNDLIIETITLVSIALAGLATRKFARGY